MAGDGRSSAWSDNLALLPTLVLWFLLAILCDKWPHATLSTGTHAAVGPYGPWWSCMYYESKRTLLPQVASIRYFVTAVRTVPSTEPLWLWVARWTPGFWGRGLRRKTLQKAGQGRNFTFGIMLLLCSVESPSFVLHSSEFFKKVRFKACSREQSEIQSGGRSSRAKLSWKTHGHNQGCWGTMHFPQDSGRHRMALHHSYTLQKSWQSHLQASLLISRCCFQETLKLWNTFLMMCFVYTSFHPHHLQFSNKSLSK